MKTLLAAIVLVPVGIFTLNYFGYMNVAFFAPLYEGVRRDTMIESRAYSEASIRRLYDLKRQYDSADLNGKNTIIATARHEFSIFPQKRLPADLQVWYSQIK